MSYHHLAIEGRQVISVKVELTLMNNAVTRNATTAGSGTREGNCVAGAGADLTALLRVSPQPPNFGDPRLLAIGIATTANSSRHDNGPPRSAECDDTIPERGQHISGKDPWVGDRSALHLVELPE